MILSSTWLVTRWISLRALECPVLSWSTLCPFVSSSPVAFHQLPLISCPSETTTRMVPRHRIQANGQTVGRRTHRCGRETLRIRQATDGPGQEREFFPLSASRARRLGSRGEVHKQVVSHVFVHSRCGYGRVLLSPSLVSSGQRAMLTLTSNLPDRVFTSMFLPRHDCLPRSPEISPRRNRPRRRNRQTPHRRRSRESTVRRRRCQGSPALAPRRPDGSPAHQYRGRHLQWVPHPQRRHVVCECLVSASKPRPARNFHHLWWLDASCKK